MTELINPLEENPLWYPMWSYTNNFTSDTVYGQAKQDIDYIKHKYLPKVVMSDDFNSEWQEYINEYSTKCNLNAYFNELTSEVRRRVGS